MTWLCWHVKWQRKDCSYKIFFLFLKGILCPAPCGTNIVPQGQGSERTGLLLPCGSSCDLRPDICCILGARCLRPGDPTSEYEGLYGSIFVWVLRPGRLSLEGIYCVRESLNQPGHVPAGPSLGPPEAGDIYWGFDSSLVCLFPMVDLCL